MPYIDSTAAPRFDLHGARFTGLAAPSRGAAETAVWMLEIGPGTPGKTHQLTREEVIVCLAGSASATLGDESFTLSPGDALIVPPMTDFTLSIDGPAPFRAMAIMPVGGQAIVAGGAAFTPPWAA
jgi:quercetin dioxygenase-like cupin family protein